MKYGLINSNIADIRSQPKFASERLNQLLFHDLVEIGTSRNGYVRIVKEDGYRGWVDRRFVAEISREEHNLRASGRRVIVTAVQARLCDSQGHPAEPYFVCYGSRLTPDRTASGWVKVRSPGNRSLYIKPGAIAPINSRKGKAVTGGMLVAEAKRFLGVPYLWGGLSPLGFDCSGLVQAVCRRFGIEIPRDTKDQIRFGKEIPLNERRPGDLIFFERHVGFAMSGGRLVHCSVGGPGVRINSLIAGEPLYRRDLADTIKMARRIL